MKKAIDFFTAHPARFFLLAALLWGGFMCFLNHKDGAEFSWHDLLVEANGMVFDLLVFGILLSIYEALREKRDKIERLHEEIDDYRFWDEKEATYRIMGAVKRLNKYKVSKVNLGFCFLQGAILSDANLQGAELVRVNLQKASLWGANLQGAKLWQANLQEAVLWKANLQRAKLRQANLQGVDLSGANLQKAIFWQANFWNANLQGANLTETDLQGAIVDKDWFEKLDHWEVIGREEIKAKYLIDENGVLREKQ